MDRVIIVFLLILTLINELLLEPNKLPSSFYKAKKVVHSLGMNYEKIHAILNNCTLYRGDNKTLKTCSKCGESW